MDNGFVIEGLDKLEKTLLDTAKTHFPEAVDRMLESMGWVLLRESKKALKADKRPHARFKDFWDLGGGIEFTHNINTNMIDGGTLWNSLNKGDNQNRWEYIQSSNTFRLTVGTKVNYASYINDGYKIKKPHWVPGYVDGNGIFRHDSGSPTGIMVQPREFEGVKFFDIAMQELEKIAPDIIKRELSRMVEKYYGK